MSTATVPSDSDLVRSARDGDDDAVQQLMDRHLPSVTAVCRQRLRSASDVEDATQETAERAIRELSSLRDPETVGSWMRGIAVRVCRESIRDHVRGPVCVPSSRLPDPPSWADDVEQQLLRSAEARNLHAQLEGLDERDRLALWWRDALGVPVGEVAAELGVTHGSARVLLSRARGRLRESFKGVAAAIGGIRLSVREFLDRLGRDLPVMDWSVVAQATAAVAAATVVALPVGGDGPASAAPVRPVVQPSVVPAASSAPIATEVPVAEEPSSPAADPVPAPQADPPSENRHVAAEEDGGVEGQVGPVHVTNEEPEDDPEVTAAIIDPDGDTTEGIIHAGNLPVPDLEPLVDGLP